MKKIFRTMTLIPLAGLLLTACQKSSIQDPGSNEEIAGAANGGQKGGPAPIRVKTVTTGNDVRTYTYDASWRQLGSTSTMYNTIVYDYVSSSLIKYSIYYNSGPLAGSSDLELNSKNLMIKQISPGLTGNYLYNNKKQLISHEVNWTGGDFGVTGYYYTNGNLTSMVNALNSLPNWSKSFTYYMDKPNSLSNDVFGESFRGVESKNLVKTMTSTINGTTSNESYEYEFDADGRVVKKITTKDGVLQPETLYTYY